MTEIAPHPSQPDTLTVPARLGELAVIAALLGMFGFFWAHQSMRTGFFTTAFGTPEMAALYGPIVVALVPSALRAAQGRRGPAWLAEAIANASLGLGTCWLLIAFPLDFTHLGDLFPAGVQSLFAWVTDDFGRALMILQVILMPISAVLNLRRYFLARRPLSMHAA